MRVLVPFKGRRSGANYRRWLTETLEELAELVFLDLRARETPQPADALILTGGRDVEYARYRERPLLGGHASLKRANEEAPDEPDPERDALELELVHEYLCRERPIFGICRGMQLLAVALGGTLIRDLSAFERTSGRRFLSHRDEGRDAEHEVEVLAGTRLSELAEEPIFSVNSSHHQAVYPGVLPAGLRVAALAPDGIVEALEGVEGPWGGVQWHPERLPEEMALAREVSREFLRRTLEG